MKDKDGSLMSKIFLERGIICLDGEIRQDEAKKIGKLIRQLNADDKIDTITLYIDSSGGDVDCSLDMYHTIKGSKKPVVGVVHGSANSMAAVVLQACTSRQAVKGACIILHDYFTTIKGTIRTVEEKIEKCLQDGRVKQQVIYEILAERTGQPVDEIASKCKEVKLMNAKEAKEFGLIDDVL